MSEGTIKRIAVFPIKDHGEFLFRISISDSHRIMIFAQSKANSLDFLVRYFTDPELARAFINECSMGKHTP